MNFYVDQNVDGCAVQIAKQLGRDCDVPIPWYMVYDLILYTKQALIEVFQFQLLYIIIATNKMLCIWVI